MPTIREKDGLAMSSRNAYLTPEQRSISPILYKSLQAAQIVFQNHKWHMNDDFSISVETLKAEVIKILRSEPLVSEILYVSVDDKETMKPLTHVNKLGAIISLACKVGTVRLIDNIILT